MPTKTPLRLLSASSLLLAVMVANASGALLVEDQFLTGSNSAQGDYNLGAAVGQGPSNPGYTGNYLNAGFVSPDIISGGLGYTDGTYVLKTAGGAIQSTAAAQHTRAGRLLENPFGAAGTGTVYMSFLYQASVTSGYKSLELHNGGFADSANRVLQIGLLATDGLNAGNFGLRINNNNALRLDFGAADTAVNLFVLKFNLSALAGGDSVTVYRNPGLGLEPSSGVTMTGFDIQFDRTSLAKFNGSGSSLTLDELRFGDSYFDVVPTTTSVPEPSVFALFTGLFSMAGCLFSRRRK
jgi:hypothetical protein